MKVNLGSHIIRILPSRTFRFIKGILPGNKKLRIGGWGEHQVAKELQRKGYKIVERNWHCPFGELDIVAFKDSTLIFVEVKTRKREERNFEAVDAVDIRKERRLQFLAKYYTDSQLALLRRLGVFRFQIDLFTVLYQKRPKSIKYSFELEHFPDALEWKEYGV